MLPTTTRERFSAALAEIIEQVKRDRSILAAILCGSLSHDTVWEKSDIDLVLITIDDKKVSGDFVSLYADGMNVHALMMKRADFRKAVEGSLQSGFTHSFLAKGRLLYSHDETVARLCERLQSLGERDIQVQLLTAGASALLPVYKAHKWLRTRGDLEYTALWILYAATPLAKIEVLSARQLVDREVIPQALKLNPEFFKIVYTDLLNTKKSPESVQAALIAVDDYLAQRAPVIFAPVVDHLRDAGETRTVTEIDDHFQRNFGISCASAACEYLADQGLLGKASMPVRLTKRSNVDLQELAFFYPDSPAQDAPPDEW